MRICVLGNCHVAPLKEGWEEIKADHRGVDLVFFAARGDMVVGMQPIEGRLVPDNAELAHSIRLTSGGLLDVVPAHYDAFVICGLRLRLPLLDRRLSAAVRQATVDDLVAASLSIALAQKLRSVADAPIWVLPAPQLASNGAPSGWRVGNLTYSEVVAMLAEQIRVPSVKLLAQPAQTILDGWHTTAAFTSGSRALDIGDRFSGRLHPSKDRLHMNASYGKLVLTELLRELDVSVS